MKNKIMPIVLAVFCCCSSLFAVWEGNGGIGAGSDFPSDGLFVRSDMFPKHTLLEITNLEKNVTARAIVIGASGVPGLLAVMSPGLGTKLSIPAGKVARIRILTPSPVQEIGDDGAVFEPLVASASEEPVLPVKKEELKKTVEPEKKPIEPVKEVVEPKKEEVKPAVKKEDPVVDPPPVIINQIVQSNRYIAKEPSVQKEKAPYVPAERPVKQVPPPAVAAAFMEPTAERPPITVPRIVRPKTAAAKPDRNVRDVKAPEVPRSPAAKKPAPVRSIHTPLEPVKSESPAEPHVSDIAGISEPKKKIVPEPSVSTIDEIHEPEKKLAPEPTVSTIKEIQEPEKGKPVDEPSVSTIDEIQTPKGVTEQEPAVAVIDEIKAPLIKQAVFEEAAVQNAPAIGAPPEKAEPEVTETAAEVSPKEDVKKEDTPTEEPVAEKEEQAPPVEPEPEPKLIAKAETQKDVPPPVFNGRLEKGRFYVQIGIYNEKSYSDAIVEQYGSRYPLLIEEGKIGGKTRYTIFVGPLQSGETGAIKEHFKTLGFKDAFLKRGK